MTMGYGLSRGWTAVLVASLALNLFVAGFVVAQVAWGDKVAAPAPVAEQAATPATPATPVVRRVVVEQNKALRPSMVAVRKANEAVTAALLAEPFDPAQLDAALEHLRTVTLASQTALHGTMLDAIAAMTPEQRRELAEASRRSPADRVFLGR
ncbi:MAG: periplasmic heavy metal sensor [Alphaproteobacteria bacterium]|nr:periplasmic heavy metal sensor [Alphaproteobacteria bacterium]